MGIASTRWPYPGRTLFRSCAGALIPWSVKSLYGQHIRLTVTKTLSFLWQLSSASPSTSAVNQSNVLGNISDLSAHVIITSNQWIWLYMGPSNLCCATCIAFFCVPCHFSKNLLRHVTFYNISYICIYINYIYKALMSIFVFYKSLTSILHFL